MMNFIVPASLVITGFIHIIPLSGVLGTKQLQELYGLKFKDPNIYILMRHRSVLFGLFGSLCWYSIYEPKHRSIALIGGLTTTISFMFIAQSTGGEYNDKLKRIVLGDIVAVGSLVVGSIVHFLGY